MEDVILHDSKRNRILGTLSIPQQARSVVIITHGFTSTKDSKVYLELQDELNEKGIGTFRYTYYGHGKEYYKDSKYTVSSDTTLSKCVDSIQAAISFVKSKGDYHIGLVGSSFGGLLSIIAAAQNSTIKALALKSPVTEPIEFWRERLGDVRIEKWQQEGIMHYIEHGEDFELDYAFWTDLQSYALRDLWANISCPVLIMHGGADLVVPIKQSQDFAHAINTDVKVIKGADHSYAEPEQYNEMKRLIIDFFAKAL